MDHLKMSFLLTMRIFHCYVSLPEGRGFKRVDIEDDDFFDYEYDLYMIMWSSWWQVSSSRIIVVGIPILRLGESLNISKDTYLSTKERVYACQNIPFFNQPTVPASSDMYNFLPSWHLHGKGFGWLKSWNMVNFSWGVLRTLRFDPAKPAKRQDKKDLWILRSYHVISSYFVWFSIMVSFPFVWTCSSRVVENDDSIFKGVHLLFTWVWFNQPLS